MNLIEFPEQNAVIAKDQPEYLPMPAHIDSGPERTVTCCWQLTDEEKAEIARTGIIWHQILTFGDPLQPQLLSTTKPDLSR